MDTLKNTSGVNTERERKKKEKELEKWAEKTVLVSATFNLIHYKTHSETEIKSNKGKLERIKIIQDILNKTIKSLEVKHG